MKKLAALILILTLSICMFPVNSFALSTPEDSGYITSEKVLQEVTGLYDSVAETKAADLIKRKSLTLSLLITATAEGIADVTKYGFTYLRLQRLSNGSWVNYTSYCYTGAYNDSSMKTMSFAVNAPKGYTYRLICEHYAEKPYLIFWTKNEAAYNETATLYF